MRNPARIPLVLKAIEDIWKQAPDMRLGQLIGNVMEGIALYYTEDDDFIEQMKMFYGYHLGTRKNTKTCTNKCKKLHKNEGKEKVYHNHGKKKPCYHEYVNQHWN